MRVKSLTAAVLASFAIIGCQSEDSPSVSGEPADFARLDAFPSQYTVPETAPVLIQNATVLDGLGNQMNDTDVRIQDGKIIEIGTDLTANDGENVIDAQGRWVTPGIIDVHSHLGNYPAPSVSATQDGNEMTSPNTAGVWTEHSVHPQDPGFSRAIAGGVTALQILPGSANLFGGRSVVLKPVVAPTIQEMKFPDAPYGLKMACGENPKRVYGDRGGPATRMGNVEGFRNAWIAAQDYKATWDDYAENGGDEPYRDLQLETLAGVLAGDIRIHNHCYTAEEMAVMIDLSKEFDYQITAFHHGVEAYKIADLLAENNIAGALWADWWGFKMEAYDATLANIALMEQAGATAIVHSDSDVGIQRLNQEAAKAMAAGNRLGMDIDIAQAWRWLSINAATSLGIDDVTGSLEVGKNADVVIWSGNPFSVYTLADEVYIDGAKRFDRFDENYQQVTDFELGQRVTEEAQ
ncbi:MAG: amidohydrolase [Gammaproteobacteria bacterium]|nr:amidohydrolase [Gammaproteobacteria bacterium]